MTQQNSNVGLPVDNSADPNQAEKDMAGAMNPDAGMMTPPAPAAPDMGMMQPNAAPSDAQLQATAEEGANIAIQGGMQAIDAANQSENVSEETVAKLEEGVSLIAEAKDEMKAANVPGNPGLTDNGGTTNPSAQGTGTEEA